MRRKIKTIVVDDEPRLRRGVEKLVRSIGEEWEIVGGFNSAIECLETCQTQELSFDLLITDVKMPGMDGLTLINKLKEVTNFHSVVISGYDDFTFLQTAIREGASDYLIKPIDREEFKNQLMEIKKKIVSQWQDLKLIKDMEVKASQLSYVKQLQKLSELTWQQEIDLSLLEWTKDFPSGQYRLLYFSMDNLSNKLKTYQKEDWGIWNFAIDNICDEMENDLTLQSWRWPGEDLSFWVLFHTDEEMDREIFVDHCFQFADQLKKNMRQFTPFTCSVAISRKIKDLALLTSIKEELLTYIQFRLVYGGNQVFSDESVKKWNEDKSGTVNKKIGNQIERVVFSLDNKRKKQTKHEIAGLLTMIESLESPKEIEQSIHMFGIKVINFMINRSQAIDGMSLMNEVSGLTTRTANLFELRNKVYEWMKKVLNILELNNKEMTDNPIDIAKQWIVNHLDKNITIQKIADNVYMNPTYFCEYFKNQTGETVLDFVTRVRLEKARDLLTSKDLKIYDVSEMVGYTNAKYFSKLFKKYYGETPSQYKDKLIMEQS
ncbi:response regulator transcription factor [Aquibacillus saliphilus]|uniref:response regulator transcription factor n=1 Tax=Aquibacillus saliphilus TaxID=1909422 RepID=UPI001CF05742